MTRCIHGKYHCRICHSSQYCEHNKYKHTCRECSPDSKAFCEHNKFKRTCRECSPAAFCKHNIRKDKCRDCSPDSKAFCEHSKFKNDCRICNPDSKAFCKSCRLFHVNAKNDYLCSYCCPKSSKRQKTKEMIIYNLLEDYLDYPFIHNKEFINNQCLRYRPDFLFESENFFLVLEVDENAHRNYDNECEFVRMNNISSVLLKPTRFIRYNPDDKTSTEEVKHCCLISTLQENLSYRFLNDISPVYLFY